MDIAQWMKENDIPVKIRAALEQIVNGQAWSVFDGLQDGIVILKVSYDGININIDRMSPPPVEWTKAEITAESALPEPVVDDPPNVVEETQTRRKGRHGSRNETE